MQCYSKDRATILCKNARFGIKFKNGAETSRVVISTVNVALNFRTISISGDTCDIQYLASSE